MADSENIRVYNAKSFTSKFMPSDGLKAIVNVEKDNFFITRLEEMYKLVTRNVPASRSTINNCLFVTEGKHP